MNAAAFPVIPCCRHDVIGLFPQAGGACVVLVIWLESVQRTVATYATRLGVLDHVTPCLSSVKQAAANAADICCVLFVGHCSGKLSDLVRHDLDLHGHCIG